MNQQTTLLVDALEASKRIWAKYGALKLIDATTTALVLARRERLSSSASLPTQLTTAAEVVADEAIAANSPLVAAAILGAAAIGLGSSMVGLATGLSMRKRAFELCMPVMPHSYELAILAMIHVDAEQDPAERIRTLDAAIEALSALSALHGAALHPQAANLMFLCYMKRGAAKSNVRSMGGVAALTDLDRAVTAADEFFQTMPSAVTDSWRNDLAAVLSNRAQVRQGVGGYGPRIAVEDFDRAIEIRQILADELGERFPPGWRARHAISFLSRANTKMLMRPRQTAECIADYDRAIEILISTLKEPESSLHEDWRNWLAMALMNRANLKAELEESDKREALNELTESILLMHGIIQRCGQRAPDDLRSNLAAVYVNRAELLAKFPDDRAEEITADLDQSIQIYLELLEKNGDRALPTWRSHLAMTLNNRANRKRTIKSFGPCSALKDYDAALAIWREDKLARHLAKGLWLSTHVGAAVCRLELGFLREAADLLEYAALERRQLVAEAPLREEQKTYLHSGRGIASWGAWVYAQLGEPARALLFLEAQRSQFLKESLLSNPVALSARLGRERAEAIGELEATIRRLRLKEIKDIEKGLNEQEREQLIANVSLLNRLLDQAERDRVAAPFTVDSIANLAPSEGALLVPVTVRLGTIVFVIRHGSPIEFVTLPNLGTPRLVAWSESFFEAEARYIGRGAAPLAFNEFDAKLVAQTKQYWDEFVGPLVRHLEDEFGIPQSAPITFATQGMLDVLPIHAAWRDEGGKRRHLIEDRVVRFAPGLTALELMRQRSRARMQGHSRKRSIAAFVAPMWPGIDAREVLAAARDVEWPRVRMLPWDQIHGPFVGESATVEAFLSLMQDAAGSPIVSDLLLSMHASFDPVTPEDSALVFAGKRGRRVMLKVTDLLAFKPACELDHVAMPACRSAQAGLHQVSDESIGLVSAMIQAGAASVLSCLYSVRDEVAAELVPKFFEGRLTTGKDIAEVVRDTAISKVSGTEQSQSRGSAIRLKILANSSTASGSAPCLADWAAFKPTCFG